MKTLTEKQKNILEFIEEFLDREGMAQTVYEIAAQTAVKPRSGDIVVALLQGGEVTVKSFFPKTQGRIELRTANPEYNVQIYPASEVSIQGRVIELRRKY